MSRPAPSPKQNFLQTALIMLVVYFAVMMFFNGRNQQKADPNTSNLATTADYLKLLQTYDRDGKEKSAQDLISGFNAAVDDSVKKKAITADEGEAEKIQAETYVANALLKGGERKNDSNQIRTAYQTLQPFFRTDQTNPGWSAPLTVTDLSGRAVTTSPKILHQEITDTLSVRNRTDKVWGFIPGGYRLIDTLVNLTGAQPYFSYWFAAFLLALAVRAAVFPLAQKQLMFSRQMSQLTPRIAEIKKQYQNDPTEQQKRTMALYKEYGINPMAGCLPAFVQMPLFLTVYQCMLHYQFQFSHGYFLWINPVTSAAAHGILAGKIAHDLGQQDYLLIIIYGISMTISTMLTPVTDPTQAKQQRMLGVGMSIMITVFMFIGIVPVVSGFVLYWTFTNILATLQSFRAYRLPMPALVKVNAPGGGVYPSSKKPQGIWMKMLEDAQRLSEDKGKDGGSSQEPSNGRAKPALNGPAPDKTAHNGKSNGKTEKKPAEDNNGKTQKGKQPKYKPKKRG